MTFAKNSWSVWEHVFPFNSHIARGNHGWTKCDTLLHAHADTHVSICVRVSENYIRLGLINLCILISFLSYPDIKSSLVHVLEDY